MHNGFSYRLTIGELIYLLFGKKVCPVCGGELTKTKEFATVPGSEIPGKRGFFFASNAKVKSYRYEFTCSRCGEKFSLDELTGKGR